MTATTITADPRPRVLYVTHRVPYPPDKGDRIRNWHVLRALHGMARVSLACLADEPVTDTTREKLAETSDELTIEPVSKFGKSVSAAKSALFGRSLSEGIFANANLKRTVNQWHTQEPFDAVMISASSLAAYIRTPALKHVPAFVDVVDVDSQKWFDFAGSVGIPKRWLYRFEGRRVRKLETEIAEWADTITLVSGPEATLFDVVVDIAGAVVATNGVDLDYFQPTTDAVEPAVAFVGAMDYLPNVDAVTWFAKDVWPKIHSQRPDAEFRIIGRNPAESVKSLAAIAGVKIIGGVPDVRPHLAKASVVVAPLRIARGLQNKVLEALAAGKAVVAGPPALAALATVPGRDLLRAETVNDWVDSVIALLGDADHRADLGAAGRQFVEQNHDWDTCLKPLTDRLRVVCGKQDAVGVPA